MTGHTAVASGVKATGLSKIPYCGRCRFEPANSAPAHRVLLLTQWILPCQIDRTGPILPTWLQLHIMTDEPASFRWFRRIFGSSKIFLGAENGWNLHIPRATPGTFFVAGLCGPNAVG
jgi:hypothetical protein